MSESVLKDIETLIELFESSDWSEMKLKTAQFELFLSNDPNARNVISETSTAGLARPADVPAATSAATASAVEPAAAVVSVPDGHALVKAPNLGTFYRAPKPGAPPYVEVGDRVEIGAELCLIEVMKLFTAVKSEVAGTIREICADDAGLVENDQALFLIELDA
ncbi:MAG: acetyl-CoA carboxylase biotin carboxyl carrier protein [Pseudomonadota bacterium]